MSFNDNYTSPLTDAELLTWLNDALAKSTPALKLPERSDMPFVFLVGLPRSGSTLASQILLKGLPLGYVDNLAAKLWTAPAIGLRVSRMVFSGGRDITFDSDMGMTPSPSDPHEFGYFWKRWLAADFFRKTSQHTDWQAMRRELFQMAAAAGAPLLFKTLLASGYITELAAVLPRVVFVNVRRNLLDNTLSILEVRQRSLAMGQEWPFHAEVGPNVPAIETQVAEYCKNYMALLEGSLGQAGALDHVQTLTLDYEQLCLKPDLCVERLAQVLSEAGFALPQALLGRVFQPQHPVMMPEREQMRVALAKAGLPYE